MKQNKQQFNTRLNQETIKTLRSFKDYKQESMARFIEKAIKNYKKKIMEGKK